jgi:molecular chaperone DnaK
MKRQHTRVGVSIQVRVSSLDVDEFVKHFATNISRGGIFIQCIEPKPKGTVLLFEIQLKGGRVAIRGKGEVIWTRSRSEDEPSTKPPGMGVKFLALDKFSKAVVKRILEIKAGKDTIKAQPRPSVGSIPPQGKPDEEPVAMNFDIEVAPAEESEEEELDDIQVDVSVDDFLESAEEDPPVGTSSSPVIGIDLGTTNSCAAVVIDGKPRIIPSHRGYNTTPSVVAYSEEGKLLVGHEAKAQMELNPINTIYGSKRLIGRHYSSPAVQQVKDRFHYKIVNGPNHEAYVEIRGQMLDLKKVSAFILKEFKELAEEMLRQEVNRAVISVPAYYNENQRQAVREAGNLAGLAVDRIVNEPTAAALAYGYKQGLEKRILVYDLGGGTFDASLLDLYEDVFEVISTGGDSFLGGVDFDNQLIDHVLNEFCQEIGQVPELNRVAMQRLRNAVEHAKCELSEKESTTVHVPFFVKVADQPRDLKIDLNRETQEMLVAPLVERSMQVVEAVLEKAKEQAAKPDDVILVGGQTRMPLVRRHLVQKFKKEPQKGVHPDEAVAIGAALLGNALGKIDNVLLIDVLAVSIGYGLPGGGFRPVLMAGNTLPSSVTFVIRTEQNQQKSLDLLVFQGDSDRVLNNEYLGTVTISEISPSPKGKVQLKVTFNLDREGLLEVASVEHQTEIENTTTMVMKHDEAAIREILRIPGDEHATEQIGIPPKQKPAV